MKPLYQIVDRKDSAYPAEPDSEYGWEKLFSERLYLGFHRNYGMEVRIPRYHSIFGLKGPGGVAGKKRRRLFAARWPRLRTGER
jgi:nucleoside-diphosphate-sugar epimerase